jgi:hypothetical protein
MAAFRSREARVHLPLSRMSLGIIEYRIERNLVPRDDATTRG